MKRSILGRAAFSAVVALALGFGARSAVASPAAAAARPYCDDDIACDEMCQRMYGPDAGGYCSSGSTCYCYY